MCNAAQGVYKFAERALFGLDFTAKKQEYSLSDVRAVISPAFGRAWAVLREFVTDGKVLKLEEISDYDKACLLFTRIHK